MRVGGDVQTERHRLAVVVEELDRGARRPPRLPAGAVALGDRCAPGLHRQGRQGLIDEAMRIEETDIYGESVSGTPSPGTFIFTSARQSTARGPIAVSPPGFRPGRPGDLASRTALRYQRRDPLHLRVVR
jgi:hypothetical protein